MRSHRVMLSGLLMLAACVAAEPTPDVEHIVVPGSLEGLPFSSAVRVGNMLYLSGQVGTVPGTMELIEGGVAAETQQTMENIRTVLQYAGSDLDRVVKCTVFLADMADYQAMNGAYREFFSGAPPARSAIAGSGLALGAQVEIECLATVDIPQH